MPAQLGAATHQLVVPARKEKWTFRPLHHLDIWLYCEYGDALQLFMQVDKSDAKSAQ
jgi:hypothetical protein